MLPFLKRNQEVAASGPVETIKRDHDEDSEFDSMESAFEDLKAALHSGDSKAGAAALRAAIELHSETKEPNGST